MLTFSGVSTQVGEKKIDMVGAADLLDVENFSKLGCPIHITEWSTDLLTSKTVLSDISALDILRVADPGNLLASVADSEDGDSKVEDSGINVRAAFVVNLMPLVC